MSNIVLRQLPSIGCARPAGAQRRNSFSETLRSLPPVAFLITGVFALILGRLLSDLGGTSAPVVDGLAFVIGAGGILAAIFRAPGRYASLSLTHTCIPVAIVTLCLLQLVSLPLSLIQALSPARFELSAALPTAGLDLPGLAPLSASTVAGCRALLILAICVLAHFLAVLGARHSSAARWLAVAPVVAFAVIQASSVLPDSAQAASSGSFVDRNHFCAFLEMALPFAVMFPRSVGGLRQRAFAWCVAALLSSLLLNGIFRSGSRMGFLSTCLGLAICGVGCYGGARGAPRRAIAFIAVVFCGAILILVMPSELGDRLLTFGDAADSSARSRWTAWRDALPLSASYPLFGVGLGAFDSVFTRFQHSSVLYRFDHAHNDYLEWIIETGLAGGILLAIGLAAMVRAITRAFVSQAAAERHFAIACAASLAAIGVHSLADFSLRLPVNGLTCAWIIGLVPACRYRPWNRVTPAVLRFSIAFMGVLLIAAALQDRARASDHVDPTPSRAEREKALSEDPANAYLWADLADRLHEEGDTARATQCFRRAVFLAPDQPRILVRAAEYFTSVENKTMSLTLCSHVLQGTRAYDRNVFDMLDWEEITPAQFIGTMIRGNDDAVRAYLDHCIASAQLNGCDAIWNWLTVRHAATDQLAGEYAEALSVQDRNAEAISFWTRYLGPRARSYLTGNLIFNGDFETESTGALFDWRTAPVEGVEVRRDSARKKSGLWSLRVAADPRFRSLYNATIQTLVLKPGRYHFTAAVWSTSADPDGRFGFQFIDPESPGRLNVHTEVGGQAGGWQQIETAFQVSPLSRKIVLALFRPELFRDGSGEPQWVDDLRLERTDRD